MTMTEPTEAESIDLRAVRDLYDNWRYAVDQVERWTEARSAFRDDLTKALGLPDEPGEDDVRRWVGMLDGQAAVRFTWTEGSYRVNSELLKERYPDAYNGSMKQSAGHWTWTPARLRKTSP